MDPPVEVGQYLQVGVKFGSLERLWDTYRKFAMENNFIIYTSSETKCISSWQAGVHGCVLFRCCINRTSRGVKVVDSECPAHVKVKPTSVGGWEIISFHTSHNHLLNTQMGMEVPYRSKDRRRHRITAAIGPYDEGEYGGKKMIEAENVATVNWIDGFIALKKRLAGLHGHLCSLTIGSKGRGFAWLEPHSREHVQSFTEVICIDCSSEIVYDVPYIIILSVVVGGKKTVTGGACLDIADGPLIQWCFLQWRKLLKNATPNVVICGWDTVVDDAIAKAFDNPQRVYPMWKISYEIMHKMLPQLGGQSNEFEYWIKRARDCFSEVQFNKIWDQMALQFGVTECPLMKFLYLHRDKWAIKMTPLLLVEALRDYEKWEFSNVGSNIDPKMGVAKFLGVYKQMLKG